MHIFTSIHISYRRYVCRWTHVVRSHICVPLRVLTLRTSWCTCMYSPVYIYLITDTFCIWTRVVQTHICVPLQVLKPRSSGQDMPGPWVATNLCHLTIYVYFFFMCMYKHIYFFLCVYVCLRVLNLRWDILVLVDFFQNVQSHTEHFVLSQWRLELASIAETERLNWNDNRLCWLKKMVSAYLAVGWRGSHSKNLVHRNGLTVRTLEAKRFLVWRFFEGSKCAEWKFWKNKKVLSDCPSV